MICTDCALKNVCSGCISCDSFPRSIDIEPCLSCSDVDTPCQMTPRQEGDKDVK